MHPHYLPLPCRPQAPLYTMTCPENTHLRRHRHLCCPSCRTFHSYKNLRPQPAGSMYTPDRSNLSIPRPRSAIDSPRRRSPTQVTPRPLTPDISSLRSLTKAPERPSQEQQDVTRLGTGGTNVGERSRYPSEVSLVPSLPRFAPQQRRPPPLSIPGTESTRTTITDYRHSSATSLASRDFAFPGSFNDS